MEETDDDQFGRHIDCNDGESEDQVTYYSYHGNLSSDDVNFWHFVWWSSHE